MENVEYGQWCTVRGKRYMIISGTLNGVTVNTDHGRRWFDKSVVTEVSDFMDTDAERKAAGKVF
jgi:hypothetical protein